MSLRVPPCCPGVPGPGVRSTKFVLHCQRHFECPPEGYLTPTQRRERELRQLRSALARATRDAQDKEERLAALERELDQLRLGEQVRAPRSAAPTGVAPVACEVPSPTPHPVSHFSRRSQRLSGDHLGGDGP